MTKETRYYLIGYMEQYEEFVFAEYRGGKIDFHHGEIRVMNEKYYREKAKEKTEDFLLRFEYLTSPEDTERKYYKKMKEDKNDLDTIGLLRRFHLSFLPNIEVGIENLGCTSVLPRKMYDNKLFIKRETFRKIKIGEYEETKQELEKNSEEVEIKWIEKEIEKEKLRYLFHN